MSERSERALWKNSSDEACKITTGFNCRVACFWPDSTFEQKYASGRTLATVSNFECLKALCVGVVVVLVISTTELLPQFVWLAWFVSLARSLANFIKNAHIKMRHILA